MRFVMCAILASLFATDAIGDEQTTIIHVGTLLAVPGNAPATNQLRLLPGMGKMPMNSAMMVESGMTEMDAIRPATVVAAELLEMSDTLGTIEPGKMADIIAVDLSPLDDITVL